MQRASGYGKAPPVPWRGRMRPGPPSAGFGPRPVRQFAKVALAALLVVNGVIVYRLADNTDASSVSGVPDRAERNTAQGSAIEELREALQNLQTGFAELKAPKPTPQTDRLRPDEREPRASSSSEGSGSASTGSTSETVSTGSSASGGGSTSSGSTDSGSGSTDSGSGSSGSGGGDPDTDDSGGGGPGGGGGDTGGGGSGGGDTGGGSGGGGGGGLAPMLDELVHLISG
jgi:hypothetical protein